MSLTTTPSNALTFDLRGSLGLAGAEISAFDPGSDRLFVTSSVGLQVVDLSNPAAPSLITTINLTAPGYGFATTDVTSVAIKNGIVAVALPALSKADPGQVVFLNAATGTLLGAATVGALPDMVTFSPDGTRVLVANEGEYLTNNATPTEGSVSIIDISGGFGGPLPVATAGFGAFDAATLRAEGVRIFAGQTAALDLEPEYIAVNAAGTLAMVTLQEANAVGILDLATATFTDVVALGTKDFSTLLADFSDRDSATPSGGNKLQLETGNPVFGLYMPDAIDAYEAGGQTFFVIANEGDDRNDFLSPDEVVTLSSASYDLDNTLFPNEATLKTDAELGRLQVVNTFDYSGTTPTPDALLRGDTDGDGDIDQILMLGGRSFSILDSTGAIVFDSADLVERIAAELVADGLISLSTFDGRSDNKGPEPESIEIGTIGGRTYAFVGLERANVTLTFDVTDPTDVTYTGFAQRPGDVAPEGGLFISATDSPTGEALFVTSNESSNNISVFGVNETFTLQILHAADWEAGVAAVERAPNFAAIVDALEEKVTNSITLLSGDNFIPGPFTAAGTDPSIRDELASFYEQFFGLPAGSLTAIRTAFAVPFNAIDIAIANALGVQASVLGNHEFDLGTNALAGAINSAVSGSNATNIGALFPYLSANLNFPVNSDLAPLFTANLLNAAEFGFRASDFSAATGQVTNAAGASRPQIAPWTIIEENGEQIGVLGLTTQLLTSISSTGSLTVADPAGDGGVDNMAELAAILQPLVDQMTALGLNKIILLTHLQQIANERLLATLLNDVDVIIGGGSNTIFADGTDVIEAGDTVGGNYPEFYTSADGTHQVALVNTDGNFNYVGRLVVTFDSEGRIIPASVDPNVSGAYVTDDAGVDAVAGNGDGVLDAAEEAAIFADGTRGGEVKQLADAVGSVITVQDGNVLGFTDVFLEGRRNVVRSEETNLGNLTADANLAVAKGFDLTTVISLKNGGGIRAEIGTVIGQPIPDLLPPLANPGAGKPEGGVSQLDIQNSLRFNNGLSLLTLTAQGIVNMLENAVRGANPGATPGAFPQISGLKFSWDKDRASLDRVVDVAIVDQEGNIIDVLAENGSVVGDPTRAFRMVTLNFLSPDNAADPRGGDDIIVQGTAVNDTAPGAATGTLAVYTDFAQLNRVDVFNAADGTGFAAAGREQAALADFLSALHPTEATAYTVADTDRSQDERIQNLDFRSSDVVTGGAVAGAGADDLVVGTSGANAINTGAGDDSVHGAAGNDTLTGGRGGDFIVGGEGDDSLRGGNGADTLDGGEGNDVIGGGAGADVLIGGEGSDRFAFGDNALGARDIILDLDRTQNDYINLAGVDADTSTGADEAFAFIGYTGFSGTAGELRAETVGIPGGVAQRIEGDVDGDGFADLVIDVVTTAEVKAGWFVL